VAHLGSPLAGPRWMSCCTTAKSTLRWRRTEREPGRASCRVCGSAWGTRGRERTSSPCYPHRDLSFPVCSGDFSA